MPAAGLEARLVPLEKAAGIALMRKHLDPLTRD
jgi:hypothetical protein